MKKPKRNDMISEAKNASNVTASGQPGKNPRQRKNTRAKGPSGHPVVHQFVRHAIKQQKSQHIDGLDEIFFHHAGADVAGDARGQSRHAGKRPPDHHQQVIRDHIVIRIADDLFASAAGGFHGLRKSPPREISA